MPAATDANVDGLELASLQVSFWEKVVSGELTIDQLRWFIDLTSEQRDTLMNGQEAPAQALESLAEKMVILRCISEELVIDATDGGEVIPGDKETFPGGIDSDFQNWGADEAGGPTPATKVKVHEMVADATFKQMFDSVTKKTDKLCLTQGQIKKFCQQHRDKLRKEGYATFFVFKSKGKFFVADVYFGGIGRLEVDVDQFEFDRVWSAEHRRRVVIPQL